MPSLSTLYKYIAYYCCEPRLITTLIKKEWKRVKHNWGKWTLAKTEGFNDAKLLRYYETVALAVYEDFLDQPIHIYILRFNISNTRVL